MNVFVAHFRGIPNDIVLKLRIPRLVPNKTVQKRTTTLPVLGSVFADNIYRVFTVLYVFPCFGVNVQCI